MNLLARFSADASLPVRKYVNDAFWTLIERKKKIYESLVIDLVLLLIIETDPN